LSDRATTRRRAAALVLLSLAVGGFVLAYRGPGRALVRGHLGDVAVVLCVYFALAVATRLSSRVRLALVAAIAVATELFQAVSPALSRSTLVDLTVGRTFDPWDLVAYALGLAIAYVADRRWVDPPSH
jgi:hypothetical protein